MKALAYLAVFVAGLAASTPVNDYGSTSGSGYGSSTDYETKCTPYYDNEVHDKCEHYTERVCYTSQQETCKDVDDKICRGIVTGRQYRKCFNVTELLCGLKEEIRYDVVQAVFTVQKCHKVSERVCDTVYEPQFTNKDDYQCIVLKTPRCHAQEQTVVDKTCRTTTKFDCSSYNHYHQPSYQSGYGSGSSVTSVGGDSYGSSGDSYGSSDSYAVPEPTCTRTQDTKCYTTPRSVTSQVCEHGEEKVCEKMNEKVPIPAEKQVCHDEEKKVCELEQRQQPKQIKKYVYTKQCRSVPRRVCENADSKQLVPSCVPTTRKQCHYTPVEKCEDVPKQHCYKVSKRVQKERCETVPKVEPAYPAEPSYSAEPAYPAEPAYSAEPAYPSTGDDYSK